jgi:von Willebrand factor type A domain
MRSTMVAKILLGIAVCLFVGVSLLDCVSDLPPIGQPAGSGGNRGATGSGGKGGAAGNGDNNGAGGTTALLSLPPGGEGGSMDSVSDASVSVPASPDANCGSQTQNPTPQPVDLLLVLDRSASMSYDIASNGNCSGGAAAGCAGRWSTITTSLSQVLAAAQTEINWGLKFFPSPGGTGCTVNPGADVEVGQSTDKMQAAIVGSGPGPTGTQTPTAAAIKEAVTYFNTVTDGRTHFILLATDGLPNCDPGTSSDVTQTSIQDTADAIAVALGQGIKTYVIGIGPSPGNLDSFAAAGETGNYFPATSPDALTTALSTIVVSVASCVFTMTEVPPDPNNLGVYLDKNTKVPLDASDGYSLGADNVTVTFNGSFCDQIQNGTYKLVQVFLGCPGGPLPPNVIP